MRSAQRDGVPNSVLGRVMLILTALGSADGELTLAEICRRTGITKPTAHRLLAALLEWNVVERSSGGVRLGLALFEMGQRAPVQARLREIAAPFLSDLFEATGETVHLAVLDGTDVVYVQKISGRKSPEVASRLGGRIPAYCTAVGKAMLAFSSPDTVKAVLQSGLQRRTPRTIVVPALLRRELEKVREHGFAEEHEESGPGTACVAAPILDGEGSALAALSITGWASALDTRRYSPAVRTTALGVSRSLAEVARRRRTLSDAS